MKLCKQCFKEFKGRNRKGRKSEVSPFCSKKCYWNSMTILLKCSTCGIKFKRTSNGVLKYCSKKCMRSGEFIDLQRKSHLGKLAWNLGKPNTWSNGEKSNFWKGGLLKSNYNERHNFMETLEYKNWRRSVFERDNYECQMCGVRGGELRANHIKRYVDYPDLRIELLNGITICRNCDLKFVMHHEKDWESYFNFNLMTRGYIKGVENYV